MHYKPQKFSASEQYFFTPVKMIAIRFRFVASWVNFNTLNFLYLYTQLCDLNVLKNRFRPKADIYPSNFKFVPEAESDEIGLCYPELILAL